MSSLAKHSALAANMDRMFWAETSEIKWERHAHINSLAFILCPSVPNNYLSTDWTAYGHTSTSKLFTAHMHHTSTVLGTYCCWRNMTFIHLRFNSDQMSKWREKNTGYAPCTGVKLSANFSESRTGLQAAWILCLSVLPPDLDFQMKCKMYIYLKRGLWTTEQE